MSHSNTVGGSSAGQLLNCPGSRQLIQIANLTDVPNDAAEAGTAWHEVIELCLKHNLDPEHLIGGTFNGVTYTECDYVDFLRPVYEWFGKLQTLKDFTYSLEERVSLETLIPGAFGTADVIYSYVDTSNPEEPRTVCGIIDWKFGRVDVEAHLNPQIFFYLSGAILKGSLPKLDAYTCYIAQPSVSEPVKETVITYDELIEFQNALQQAYIESLGPFPALNKSAYCTYCDAKSICPIWSGAVAESVTLSIGDVELADLHDRAADAKKWAAAIDKHIKDILVTKKGVIKGLKRVVFRNGSFYTNEMDVIDTLQHAGISDEQMYVAPKLKSPSQLRKAIGNDRVNELLGDLIHKKPNAFQIVSSDDKRDAYVPPEAEPVAGLDALEDLGKSKLTI